MNRSSIIVSIISPPHREALCAEIIVGSIQLVEINQENGSLTVEIYPRPDGKQWEIGYDELVASLTTAKERLVGK